MNAYVLHRPDGSETDVSVCGICEQAAKGLGNKFLSERCCKCPECGMETGSKSTTERCPPCAVKFAQQLDSDRIEKAETVTAYTGPLYCEGIGSSDGYFRNMEELTECLEFRKGERPEFAFCCNIRRFRLDADSIIESACEDFYDDAYGDLDGIGTLEAAISQFNKANESVEAWDVTYKRKVAIPVDDREMGA